MKIGQNQVEKNRDIFGLKDFGVLIRGPFVDQLSGSGLSESNVER